MNWQELNQASLDGILAWAESQTWCQAMAACAQDAQWHSEGDVWTMPGSYSSGSGSQTSPDRATYIQAAKAAGFQVAGYYFQSKLDDCLTRNAARPEAERVPDMAIMGTYKRRQLPSLDEGFDRLYYVRTTSDGDFVVEEWRDEV